MSGRRKRLLGGFAVAAAIVAVFLWAVGPRDVAVRLSQADPLVVSVGFVAVLGALWCWSESLAWLLAGEDDSVGGPRYRTAYLSVAFLKKIVPMGQVAAPIFLAYVVGRETDVSYDRTLAATSVFSLLNIATSLVVGSLALASLFATGQAPGGTLFAVLIAVLVASIVAVVAVLAVVYYRRPLLERATRRLAAAVRETVGRFSTRVEAALAPERVRAAVADLSVAVDRVVANRRTVSVAVVYSVAGWALFLLPIYTGLLALDAHVPYALVVFVAVVVMMVNVAPLPGGFGGFDVATAGLLSSVAGVSLPTVAAALFIYRLSNYWFVLLIGGVASMALSLEVEDPPSVLPEDEAAVETGLLRGDEETA